MRIPPILTRWVETLAAVLLAWRERRREQRALTIACENEHLVVRGFRSDRDTAQPQFRAGQKVSADLLHAARNCLVVLEFPADKVVTRDIAVPEKAQKFLSGVIRNQIERLSPWPPNNMVYGFNSETSGENASVVDVRILMASRTDIDASLQQSAALGVEVDRIVTNSLTAATADKRDGYVTLWSRSADASRQRLDGTSRVIGLGIAATVAASICLSLWAFISTGLVQDESEGVAARAKALQRQLQSGRMPSSAGSMPPMERAWFLKENSLSSMVLIEALSRALPDSAYLTELRLDNSNLRITGLAEDAPGLLTPLERSGHLTGVHFFAPTTRGPDGKSFRFSIEAHVEPHTKIGEE
jgi:general secretion pathway protein L